MNESRWEVDWTFFIVQSRKCFPSSLIYECIGQSFTCVHVGKDQLESRMMMNENTANRAGRIFNVALLVIALLFTESTFASTGDASTTHFSQQQITHYINTVATELQLSKGWKSSTGEDSGNSIYCQSQLLGQGRRAGSQGLYAWFTCSTMHQLDLSQANTSTLACTGFSSPVWIQPTAGSIKFQTISYATNYQKLKSSIPAKVRSQMEIAFSQLYPGQPRILIARATRGVSTAVASNPPLCQ